MDPRVKLEDDETRTVMTDMPHKTNFIKKIIEADLAAGTYKHIVTRFPPEPNGFLHVGHAKAICLNFGLGQDYNTPCHLRFDDTNPCNESEEYIHAIMRDIKWLGFNWGDNLHYASNYFDTLYDIAVQLIKDGHAYVCSLSPEQVRDYRGTITEPGKNSPDRERPTDESLDLLARMKAGEFDEGTYALRAKIDMSSGNMNMRDPMLYRIRKVSHHRTGDTWCIYPMYDFTHPISDALEGITHSLCSLEFQDHRPLYNWMVEHSGVKAHPQQIEFSRLKLSYTITSKRKLKSLVEGNHVSGWGDPRMPTISGLRRRGFTPASIQTFCAQIGISKQDSTTDMGQLEQCLRDDLNAKAPRRMAVLKPLKVVIDSFDDTEVQMLNVSNHPQNPDFGRRDIPFCQEIYIDQDDFMLEATPGFKRLIPGGRVRLLNAYVLECTRVKQDADGNVTQLHCNHLPETLGGKKPEDGKKVKGFIQWVSARHAKAATVRVYDRLFNIENPSASDDPSEALNPNALEVIENAMIEPSLCEAKGEDAFQFNRVGYFCADQVDHTADKPVFNRSVSLRDGWVK
jgi:glutaminyl-tRNA synthetase